MVFIMQSLNQEPRHSDRVPPNRLGNQYNISPDDDNDEGEGKVELELEAEVEVAGEEGAPRSSQAIPCCKRRSSTFEILSSPQLNSLWISQADTCMLS